MTRARSTRGVDLEWLITQIEYVLGIDGGWMSANAIYNRIEIEDKQTLVEVIEDLVGKAKLQMIEGPLGVEYALPGVAAPTVIARPANSGVTQLAHDLVESAATQTSEADRREADVGAAKAAILRELRGGKQLTSENLFKVSYASQVSFNAALQRLLDEKQITGHGSGRGAQYELNLLPHNPAGEPMSKNDQSESIEGKIKLRDRVAALLAADPSITAREAAEQLGDAKVDAVGYHLTNLRRENAPASSSSSTVNQFVERKRTAAAPKPQRRKPTELPLDDELLALSARLAPIEHLGEKVAVLDQLSTHFVGKVGTLLVEIRADLVRMAPHA